MVNHATEVYKQALKGDLLLVARGSDILKELHSANAIQEAVETYRRTGGVGDLIRLRDLRVQSGRELGQHAAKAGGADASRDYSFGVVSTSKDLVELDAREVAADRLAQVLRNEGVAQLNNLMSAEDALDFQNMIAELQAVIAEFKTAQISGADTRRSTNSKAVFTPLPGTQIRILESWFGPYVAIPLFLSPKLSFHLLDSLEAAGLRCALQHVLQDGVCCSHRNTVARRHAEGATQAAWTCHDTQGPSGAMSVGLWIALTACGETADAVGLEVAPSDVATPYRPHLLPGDAVILRSDTRYCMSARHVSAQPCLAIEIWFHAKSQIPQAMQPVVW